MIELNQFMLMAGVMLVLFCTAAFLPAKAKETISLYFDGNKQVMYYIFLSAIFFVALFVRVYQFGNVPGGFNQDGAMAAVEAKALAEYGTDRFGMYKPVHLTGWGYGQMSSLLSYMMAVCIKLFGFSTVTVRLPLLLMSLTGLVFLYLFVREAFGEGPALAAAFFGAVNPWHILQSRWALDCNLYPHFFLIGLTFLLYAVNRKHRKLFLSLSMIAFGLSMYCYGVAIYTTTFFLFVTVIYLLFSKRIKWYEALLAFGVYLLIAWPFLLVMAINTFKWNTVTTPFFTIPYFENSTRSTDILFFAEDKGKQFISNVKSLFSVTVLQKKDLPWNDIEGFGTVYLFSYPFVFVGLFTIIRKCREKVGAVLLLFYLLSGVVCGILTGNVNVNRINIIYYCIIILAGLGIYEAVMRFPNYRKIIGGIVVAAYFFVFILFVREYYGNYANSIKNYFFCDFENALYCVKDAEVEKYYITSDSQYEGSKHVSEILTLFCMEIDSAYFRGDKKIEGWLPYEERYQYFYTGNAYGDPAEDAAYVVTVNEIYNFDPMYYEITQFGNYYAIKKRD